jgi:tetratricopeptide (TPR) repeat protein
VLFVNLRGFHPDPNQPPADPAAVLDGFLRLLGAAGHQVPADPPARAAAYQERLAGTRTLVVLDNAATADQVRPLLPEAGGCLAIVTSRRHLAGLPGTTHLTLDVFTSAEATAFLSRAAAEVATGTDPAARARIADRCGFLPLALSLVTGHIRRTAGWTLTDHADRLDEQHLDAGTELAFTLSYQRLDAARRRLLRLLALHPGQDFDAYAAAALAGLDLATAADHLDGLRADHLVHQAAPGRYTFHDLVRAYAATRAHDEDSPTERRAACTRLFDHYLATASAAMDGLHPAGGPKRPRVPAATTPSPAFDGLDSALHWLDTERPTLVAVAAHTAGHGWPTHTILLSRTLHGYLDGGHNTDALIVHGHALEAARTSGDQTEQSRALTNLGTVLCWLGRYAESTDRLDQALSLARRLGDRAGQALALTKLGVTAGRWGRHQPAIDHFSQAIELYRQVGDPAGEARAQTSLGNIEGRLGLHRSAIEHYQHALVIHRQAGDRYGEAAALDSLGYVELRARRYAAAGDHLTESLALYRRLGSRSGEAGILDSLGLLHTRLGRPALGADHHRQALAIAREIGERYGEAWILNGLGEAAQHPADAVTHHTEALAVARDIGDREQEARAHTGLGHAHRDLGDPAAARRHYEEAGALYRDLGMPEANEIDTHLTTLG